MPLSGLSVFRSLLRLTCGLNFVAFSSPAKKITLSGLMETPFVGKKLKVLTSKQHAPTTKPTKKRNLEGMAGNQKLSHW